MKVKLLTTISFFTYQLSISQTEKLLHGKVVSQSNVLKGVEVINKTAKTSTTTNALGEFSILVNIKDSLIFFSKDYFFSRLKITHQNIETNNLVINMILKPEELKEVVITKMELPKIDFDAEAIARVNTDNEAKDLRRFIPVYDGTIPNGMNFGAISSKIISLFKTDKEEPKKKTQEIDFKKLIITTVPETFFTKDLKLTSEEKELFLQFCDADTKSKTLLEHSNILATMDFLTAKNDEFKKLKK
ncbi:hypothetical protein SAMN05444397_10647 [Flavobacterium aquidurense]|uniref:CarboxypepD_reg-like domain-containing protein n=1 Tax=Flavobacterium frigidimaris TaxID=262320 RepID=A0ABX4BRG6_FLAFR|nr:hypothetical protein [Flavobacterium frigidimaris]OXA79830.1 hypothetical protein B0A65_07720 [Flavobacterium frigidimaris]SDZ38672.1 hypothetical protein SAMN05444397_10647 [Flavobacterium aquidurense]